MKTSETITYEAADEDAAARRSYFDIDPSLTRAQRVARLQAIQPLTDMCKGVDPARLDEQSLGIIEEAALREARSNARNSGKLFPFRLRDDTGRVTTRYEGDPHAWMKTFKDPGRRITINTHAGKHLEGGRWVPDGQHLAPVNNTR